MMSFWRNFHHWLHWKLSFWQLSVQAVMKISSKWRHFHFNVWSCNRHLIIAHPFGMSFKVFIIDIYIYIYIDIYMKKNQQCYNVTTLSSDFNSQQTPHTSPSRWALVRIFQQISCIMMPSHCPLYSWRDGWIQPPIGSEQRTCSVDSMMNTSHWEWKPGQTRMLDRCIKVQPFQFGPFQFGMPSLTLLFGE